jgi:hypothetical protein
LFSEVPPHHIFTFSHDAHSQWISCRTGIIGGEKKIMKIEGFMSCNNLMPGCAQIMDPWPIASRACYFGNTPILRPGRCKKIRICRKVGNLYVQSKLQHPWLLCIWQVHAKQKTGTQLHWTYCYMFPQHFIKSPLDYMHMFIQFFTCVCFKFSLIGVSAC